MLTKDLDRRISTATSFTPAARTASANGTGVDLAGFRSSMLIFTTGIITDGTHTARLEESDDNSAFTTVAAADLSGAFTAVTSGAGGSATQEVGYLGSKRYVRAATTVTGATTGGVYGAIVVRGDALTQPV